MSYNLIACAEKVSTLVPDALVRRRLISCAVAQMVATQLPVPTEVVTSPETYFNSEIKNQATSLIGTINEKLILDVNLAVELTRKYWLLRYNTVHPIAPGKILSTANYGYFDTIMGVGVYIDPEHHEFVNQYKIEILTIYKELSYALDQGV